jgi:hypothetical protein
MSMRVTWPKRASPLAVVFLTLLVAPRDGLAEDAASQAKATPADAGQGAASQGAAPPVLPKVMLSKWRIDHNDPVRSIPTPEQRDKNPLEFGYHLMDLIAVADKLIQAGHKKMAIKYYDALARAAPETSAPFQKLCELYEATGDRARAAGSCGTALSRHGATLADYQRFLRLVFAKEGALAPNEVKDVEGVIQHLNADKNPKARELATQTQCELGTRTSDAKRLEECVRALVKVAPNEPRTIMYQWALALQKKDLKEAERLIERAKARSMQPEGIKKMMAATTAAQPLWRRLLADRIFVIVAAIATLGGATALVWLALRRLRLRSREVA